MKKHLLTLLLLASFSIAPGFAVAAKSVVDELAAQSGLSKRQVQMVLGARSAFPEYLTSFHRVQKRLIEAVGRERYQELVKLHREGKSLPDSAVRG